MNLEKFLWTGNDFDIMSWHCSRIYALSFNENFELVFDIDYIFKTNPLKDNEKTYTFWISPATLVFKNVYDLDLSTYDLELDIMDIIRKNPTVPKNIRSIDDVLEYEWTMPLTTGEISFRSVGFTQFIRKRPELFNRPVIGLLDRGGISFSKQRLD